MRSIARVQREVHRREHQRQRQDRPPLPPGERRAAAAAHRQQHRGRDPLADRDHADRPDHAGRPGRRARPDLVGQPLPSIRAIPAPRPAPLRRPGVVHGAGRYGERPPHAGAHHTQNACARHLYAGRMEGPGAAAPALPRRDRRHRQLHRCRLELGVSQAAVSRTSPRSRASSACGCCTAPAATSRPPPRECRSGPGPAPARRGRRTSSARPPPDTPGCASATPGRRWAATPRSSSAAGPTSTRTSSCTWSGTNSPTGGLAEGLCDLAVVRAAFDGAASPRASWATSAAVCAMASDDPWARRRCIRLAEIGDRTSSSTGAPGPPPRTCGPRRTARRWSTPRTSTTGSPRSPPGAASASPRRAPHPVPPRRHRLPAAARRPPIPVHLIWRATTRTRRRTPPSPC